MNGPKSLDKARSEFIKGIVRVCREHKVTLDYGLDEYDQPYECEFVSEATKVRNSIEQRRTGENERKHGTPSSRTDEAVASHFEMYKIAEKAWKLMNQ